MDEALRIGFAWVGAACLTVYWVAVVVKLVRLGHKLRKQPNAIPREPVGQLMRVVWYPIIVVMLAGLWAVALGIARRWGWWFVPMIPVTWGWVAAASVGAVAALAGTAYTFVCWRKMGRSWRIGIDPNETLEMVSSGPYRWVRHPIYAIRMAINVAAWVMTPSAVLAVTLGADIVLLQIEARREEAYMVQTHGEMYEGYRRRVGRFLPRLKTLNPKRKARDVTGADEGPGINVRG